jgi:DNA-binding NarL/FixJ family response regulator
MLLADELTLVRDGIRCLCESTRKFHVVAEAGDGETAWKLIRQSPPDFALLDLALPRLHTLEVCRKVHEAGLPTLMGVLTHRRDRKTLLEILRAHASGVLLKSDPAEYLLDGLRRMTTGNIYVSSSIDAIGLFTAEGGSSSAEPLAALSAREYQVFGLLVEGTRPKEIAARLDLSAKTVDTYRASLMRKLDIHDVAGLVKFALQHGLTK